MMSHVVMYKESLWMQLKSFQQKHSQSSISITKLNQEKKEILDLKESQEEMDKMALMVLRDQKDQMVQ